jgi:hypothetical protein
VNALAARRSVVGTIVVHGIHTLLWALDVLAKSEFRPANIHFLDVRFPKAVYLDDPVKLTIRDRTPEKIHLEATVGDRIVASIRLGCSHDSNVRLADNVSPDETELLATDGEPTDLSFGAFAGRVGLVDYVRPQHDFAKAFPYVAALIGATRVRAIAACSRLVGMECPGLRSIFSHLSATLTDDFVAPNIVYEVVKADPRFNLVRMQFAGAGLQGQIEAFSPPPAPKQAAIADIAKMVGPHEFEAQTALVIGGSRGLGELAAKTIAAGGGRVVITYALGQSDAEEVADEIRRFGGHASALAYDATKSDTSQLVHLDAITPTHVYYFATCRISHAKAKAFDGEVLAEFMNFYVHGFHQLCRTFREHGAKQLSFFYPSSVFVQERPYDLTEYAMAKAAGEILCSDIPRMLTDQTISITPQDLPKAIDTIIPLIRAMG